jgi:hypothetical protein
VLAKQRGARRSPVFLYVYNHLMSFSSACELAFGAGVLTTMIASPSLCDASRLGPERDLLLRCDLPRCKCKALCALCLSHVRLLACLISSETSLPLPLSAG